MSEKASWQANKLKQASLAMAGVLGFAACGGGAPSLEDSPVERFQHDYVDFYSENGGIDCLSGTAYDLDAGGRGRASVTPPSSSYNAETGVLTVTPASGKNELHVEGFDQIEHRLTPVGPEDKAIFDSYDCDTRGY